MTVLIATAVEAEADAVRAGSAGLFDVAAVGVGPAAAAAGTARLLTRAEAIGRPYQAVINAGVAGAFPGRAEIGATVIATRTIAADLGAETPGGFLPIEQLGFGTSTYESDPELFALLTKALPEALAGDVLALSTVTGTASTAARLAASYPAALAEAMEGYGVATAASTAGLPFIELRTISNLVGPRERDTWRLAEALTALTDSAGNLAAGLTESR